MKNKINLLVLIIGLFMIAFGLLLFVQQISNFTAIIKCNYGRLTLSQMISQLLIFMLIPFFLILSGISFMLLKKWAFYFIRTSLLLLIAIGFLITFAAIFIGFTGLPSPLFYVVMVGEGMILYLINRPSTKNQFLKR